MAWVGSVLQTPTIGTFVSVYRVFCATINATGSPPVPPAVPAPETPDVGGIEMSLAGISSNVLGIWPPAGESSLETLEDLPAAVFVSLFGDERAEQHELAVGEYDRRGWWGDSFPEVPGDTWGGKLYLEERGKLSVDADPEAPGITTPERIRDRARSALQWLLDDGVASSVDIVAELRPDNRGVSLGITINRDRSDDPVTLQYDPLWEAIRDA